MSTDAPLFEVTTPAATPAARRLTTAAKVNAAMGQSASTDQVLIESFIDFVSADCARYCGLARPANGASVPTFGQEVVKATWLQARRSRGTELRLPWRVPVSAIGQVVEDGVNLVVNIDYRLIGGAMLERLSSDIPVRWSLGKIVVPYTAGWSLPDGVSAEIEGAVIDQVKLRYHATDRDPALRSDSTAEVGAETFAVAGGDSIGTSGLLKPLEDALTPFRNWAVA